MFPRSCPVLPQASTSLGRLDLSTRTLTRIDDIFVIDFGASNVTTYWPMARLGHHGYGRLWVSVDGIWYVAVDQ